MTSSRPGRQAVGQAAHPGLQHGRKLGAIALRERPAELDLERVDHACEVGLRRQQRPGKAGRLVAAHPEATGLAVVDDEALHRQGVGHLVGHDDAAKALRQGVQPAHPVAEPRALPLAQLRARLQHQPLELGLAERRGGERAGAAAELEHRAAADGRQRLDRLARHAAAEQRRDFRRGDEVAGGSELGRAAAVVAEARRVQHALHVPAEADRAAGANDLLAQPLCQRGAARERLGPWRGRAGDGLRTAGRHRLAGLWRQSSGQWRRANGDG
jgi:hypothetical protein